MFFKPTRERAVFFTLASLALAGAALAQDTIPLPAVLPKPNFIGTPSDAPAGANVEKPLGRPRPIPQVPKGTVNLALKKKVTASKAPYEGSLDLITDGVKDAKQGSAVEMYPKLQWVQIDLEAASELSYVLVWHFHEQPVVFRDVIVQVSNDPKFVEGVTTLYNNDADNSAGLGIGKDREYFETSEGRLIAANKVKARYVRLYSRGSTYTDPLNRYTEVEVYGLPSK
ncbi:hypothetical protein [Armatimonas rosea]|uniref:F5/8 type C domain-containing protein n=1 Tax=Armatimonas rosea TaxID=685828 RepID=A0A7W9SVM2_ARMRO|nr:hypothetical protein [Armatimonas rosea]MBB6052769.1 hypothetical protein [Armatimonas rosea]